MSIIIRYGEFVRDGIAPDLAFRILCRSMLRQRKAQRRWWRYTGFRYQPRTNVIFDLKWAAAQARRVARP